MSEETHDIQKEVRIYLTIFGILMFLTIVTVGVSYLHLNLAGAVTLALMIATIKATLVACYFMHLISEKKLIYYMLIMVALFFVMLMVTPVAGSKDHLVGTVPYHAGPTANVDAHH